jgi:hypothetical protein
MPANSRAARKGSMPMSAKDGEGLLLLSGIKFMNYL